MRPQLLYGIAWSKIFSNIGPWSITGPFKKSTFKRPMLNAYDLEERRREEDVDARRGPLQGIPGRVRHVLELLPRAQI